MKFESYIPCDALKQFIKALVIQESMDERSYKILPGTGIVIGFQYKGRLSYTDGQKDIPLSVSGVSGLTDSFRIFSNSKNTGSVLVIFKEAGAAPFFGQPLHELFRESVSLDNFMLRSALLIIEEQPSEAHTDSERINIVERFLISRLTAYKPDALVIAALSLIHKTKGKIRISELAQQLHTSQSPLEKRFRKVTGASPKKFASIIRFKNLIENYPPNSSLTELGHESGFYDQAHFIKEFKTFTGVTPENYFRSQNL